jgi:hypothetical protein
VNGSDLTVWETGGGAQQVEQYLDDLRTNPAAVMHGPCFIESYGAERFVTLAQEAMVSLSGSLNDAALRIVGLEDKLREHRLLPPAV